MSDDLPHVNGAADTSDALPHIEDTPVPATQVAAAIASIAADVGKIMGATVRGIIVSAPAVPPTILLPEIARAAGKMLAMITDGGTVEGTVRARKEFEAAFKDGMSKVSILKSTSAVNPPRAG